MECWKEREKWSGKVEKDMWDHLKTESEKDKELTILRMEGNGKDSGKMICSTVSDVTKLIKN